MKRMHRSLLLFVSLVVLATSCTRIKESPPSDVATSEDPSQVFDTTKLISFLGAKKQWELTSAHMRKSLDDTGSLVGAPIHIVFYDSMGHPASLVLSDSGSTDAGMRSFIVWGNVYVKTDDKKTIHAKRLWWNKSTHKIESDAFVEIRTPTGDIFRGKGLVATESFSSWEFRQNVSGYFPDFKQRMEKDENIF